MQSQTAKQRTHDFAAMLLRCSKTFLTRKKFAQKEQPRLNLWPVKLFDPVQKNTSLFFKENVFGGKGRNVMHIVRRGSSVVVESENNKF